MTGEVCVERSPVEVVDASFDRYVLDHQAVLVRYATLLAGSQALAEDLVQDVLIRLYPRWDTLAEPHLYVRRCITNEFLSWRRRWSTRNVRIVPDAVLESAAEPVPADPVRDDAPDPELWARLMRLPKQQRAAVVLRFWEGLDDDEIGEVLSCKAATVRGHVSRGLATLRAGLTKEHT